MNRVGEDGRVIGYVNRVGEDEDDGEGGRAS